MDQRPQLHETKNKASRKKPCTNLCKGNLVGKLTEKKGTERNMEEGEDLDEGDFCMIIRTDEISELETTNRTKAQT